MSISFANSLDPDQLRQDVEPDLEPNFFTMHDGNFERISL